MPDGLPVPLGAARRRSTSLGESRSLGGKAPAVDRRSNESRISTDARGWACARRLVRECAAPAGRAPLHRLPEVEPVEPARRLAAGRGELGSDRQLDRSGHRPACRLRLRALGRRSDRDPDHRRRARQRQEPRLVRLRRRVRSRPVSHPSQRQDRRWPLLHWRPARADRRPLVVPLYELYALYPKGAAGSAGSGAIWSLRSNKLRPAGWTSADAAGLPILPGLARYDEVKRGVIDHALRFTVERTRRAYVFPARHYASDSNDPSLPAMGLRLRLKASFDVSGFPGRRGSSSSPSSATGCWSQTMDRAGTSRARQTRAGRTTNCTRSAASRAPTSKSSGSRENRSNLVAEQPSDDSQGNLCHRRRRGLDRDGLRKRRQMPEAAEQ